jgi:hypothetical protein
VPLVVGVHVISKVAPINQHNEVSGGQAPALMTVPPTGEVIAYGFRTCTKKDENIILCKDRRHGKNQGDNNGAKRDNHVGAKFELEG